MKCNKSDTRLVEQVIREKLYSLDLAASSCTSRISLTSPTLQLTSSSKLSPCAFCFGILQRHLEMLCVLSGEFSKLCTHLPTIGNILKPWPESPESNMTEEQVSGT